MAVEHLPVVTAILAQRIGITLFGRYVCEAVSVVEVHVANGGDHHASRLRTLDGLGAIGSHTVRGVEHVEFAFVTLSHHAEHHAQHQQQNTIFLITVDDHFRSWL